MNLAFWVSVPLKKEGNYPMESKKESSKSWLQVITILALIILCFRSTSCKKDNENGSDGDNGNRLIGWYADLNRVAKQSDFVEINKAINNHELLSSYPSIGNYYYASYDLFIINGMYSDSDAHFGRLRFSIPNPITVYRVLDDQTFLIYNPFLYEDGAGSGEAVYKLYAGSIFGNMTYYDNPTYYTYYKSDNKLFVSNGDIFTITGSGLIKDGSSVVFSKYDPIKRY